MALIKLNSRAIPDATVTSDDLAEGAVEGALVTATGRKNLIINGAMQVAQRGTSASVSDGSNEGYSTVDRYFINFNSGAGGAVTASQSTDAPDGFANSLKLDVTTTNTFSSSGDRVGIQYYAEAQDLQSFAYGTSNAKQVTLSFYAKADNFSDKLYVSVQTIDGTVNYYFDDFTPTSTWQRFSVTLPAATAAQIDNNNDAGLRIEWVLGATTSDGASSDLSDWTTTVYRFKDDIGNLFASTDNNFYLTGVQLEVGTVATPFEHISYGEQLALCQRYCQFYADDTFIMGAAYNSDTDWYFPFQFPPMRTFPSFVPTANMLLVSNNTNNSSVATVDQGDGQSSYRSMRLTITASTLGSQGDAGWIQCQNAESFILDAEL